MKVRADGEFANHHHTYAYGAAAAHVTVDPGTGKVELVDYVTVEDVGRIVNPLTAHGQAVGAVVQGLGGTLLEHLVYDDEGQFLAGTFADYLLPSAVDFPNVRAIVLENSPSPHNPLGAKGGGEGGIVPVGGVIANAVVGRALVARASKRERFRSPHPTSGVSFMADVPITLACGLYDRMQALYTGEVKARRHRSHLPRRGFSARAVRLGDGAAAVRRVRDVELGLHHARRRAAIARSWRYPCSRRRCSGTGRSRSTGARASARRRTSKAGASA